MRYVAFMLTEDGVEEDCSFHINPFDDLCDYLDGNEFAPTFVASGRFPTASGIAEFREEFPTRGEAVSFLKRRYQEECAKAGAPLARSAFRVERVSTVCFS